MNRFPCNYFTFIHTYSKFYVARYRFSSNEFPLWWCTDSACSAANSINHSSCHKCNAVKKIDLTIDTTNSSHWVCHSCFNVNKSLLKFCQVCASTKEFKLPTVWMCPSCNTYNELSTTNFKTSNNLSNANYQLKPCLKCDFDLLNTQTNTKDNKSNLSKNSISTDEEMLSVIGVPTEFSEPPGFPWVCRNAECGQLNNGNTATCSKCKYILIPASWNCHICASENHFSRIECFLCSAPVPSGWDCKKCKTTTSVYESLCRFCLSPKPLIESTFQRVIQKSALVCMSCGTTNKHLSLYCQECNQKLSQCDNFNSIVKDANWKCNNCNTLNFRVRDTCWNCGLTASNKAISYAGMENQTVPPDIEKEGFQEITKTQEKVRMNNAAMNIKVLNNWVCSKCFEKNFKTNKECSKCNTPRMLMKMAKLRVKVPVKL